MSSANMEVGSGSKEPSQITVIVYSARELQSHRRGEVCHASVVFGHGKDFYTTEVVEGSAPEWNQEASISIPSHSQEPVKFKVKDRDHTLGSVALALAELPGSRNRLWLPLQPYKRAHEAYGSLQVGCWAVTYHQRERAATGSVQTSPQEDARPRGSRGPFGFHRHSSSWTRSTPHRHSMYEKPLGMVVAGGRVQDGLRSFQSDTNLRGAEEEEEEEGAQVKSSKSSTDHSQADITSSAGEAGVPEVTGVSPNEGPVEGGQRVVLRGSCLGESRADVMQVLVAGVDCSSSLEYFSPSKLAVVTVARAAPGSGPVLVQTRTGGVGVSWINFSFVEADDGGGLANSPRHHSKRRSRIETADSAVQAELKSYRHQVKELKDSNKSLAEENGELRGYIDRLLLAVITHSPGVLEVQPSPEPSGLHSLTQ